MTKQPYLTKSKFVPAAKCTRWLWNDFYNRPQYQPSAIGSSADVGDRIGMLAHQLFPDGVAVTAAPWAHDQAVQQTQDLMNDATVPAIFEAAFEYENTRVRVDILERMPDNTWAIREVKSAGSIRTKKLKDHYARDAAVQQYVVAGSDINISSVEFVYINKAYAGPVPDINVSDFFIREDVMHEIAEMLPDMSREIAGFMDILNGGGEPESEPSKSKCSKIASGLCPFWAQCTADKPDDWVDILYRPGRSQLTTQKEAGKHSLSDLTPEDGTTEIQKRMIKSVQDNEDIIGPDFSRAVSQISLPAIHLDFEYLAGVALPLFKGMKPFDKVPFQFSAHRIQEDGTFEHIDAYLAQGDVSPQREFAEKLINLLDGGSEPIIVWNAAGAEVPVIKGLIKDFPDLEQQLQGIIDRIHDLMLTVRENMVMRKMISKESLAGGGFFSLKNVAPACSENFSYGDLNGVANGGQAVEAFFQLVTGELPEGVSDKTLRTNMLAYCEKDTEATALVHQKLTKIKG